MSLNVSIVKIIEGNYRFKRISSFYYNFIREFSIRILDNIQVK